MRGCASRRGAAAPHYSAPRTHFGDGRQAALAEERIRCPATAGGRARSCRRCSRPPPSPPPPRCRRSVGVGGGTAGRGGTGARAEAAPAAPGRRGPPRAPPPPPGEGLPAGRLLARGELRRLRRSARWDGRNDVSRLDNPPHTSQIGRCGTAVKVPREPTRQAVQAHSIPVPSPTVAPLPSESWRSSHSRGRPSGYRENSVGGWSVWSSGS